MRSMVWLVSGILCLGLVACKKEGKAGGTTRASLEEKLERYLDKQNVPLTPLADFVQRHDFDPIFTRKSEDWELKITTQAPWDRAKPTREHHVSVAGMVTSAGGLSPETIKLVKLMVNSRYSTEFKDWEYGTRWLSIVEADMLLKAIDGAIKVQSQITLGGAEITEFNHEIMRDLYLSGELHKQLSWESKAPEFVLSLKIDKAAVELRPGDWMELKLKIEAAKKWLETQNGDLPLVTPEPVKK